MGAAFLVNSLLESSWDRTLIVSLCSTLQLVSLKGCRELTATTSLASASHHVDASLLQQASIEVLRSGNESQMASGKLCVWEYLITTGVGLSNGLVETNASSE